MTIRRLTNQYYCSACGLVMSGRLWQKHPPKCVGVKK